MFCFRRFRIRPRAHERRIRLQRPTAAGSLLRHQPGEPAFVPVLERRGTRIGRTSARAHPQPPDVKAVAVVVNGPSALHSGSEVSSGQWHGGHLRSARAQCFRWLVRQVGMTRSVLPRRARQTKLNRVRTLTLPWRLAGGISSQDADRVPFQARRDGLQGRRGGGQETSGRCALLSLRLHPTAPPVSFSARRVSPRQSAQPRRRLPRLSIPFPRRRKPDRGRLAQADSTHLLPTGLPYILLLTTLSPSPRHPFAPLPLHPPLFFSQTAQARPRWTRSTRRRFSTAHLSPLSPPLHYTLPKTPIRAFHPFRHPTPPTHPFSFLRGRKPERGGLAQPDATHLLRARTGGRRGGSCRHRRMRKDAHRSRWDACPFAWLPSLSDQPPHPSGSNPSCPHQLSALVLEAEAAAIASPQRC